MRPAKGSMPPIPKADQEAKALFESVVPDDPAVTVRPMFGNVSAFVNGNMFMGVFGPDLFVRLPEADRDAVSAMGGGPFEPMPGRPMRGFLIVPPSVERNFDDDIDWSCVRSGSAKFEVIDSRFEM